MKRLFFSSEFYYIRARDIKKLPPCHDVNYQSKEQTCVVILLKNDGNVELLSGEKILAQHQDDDYVQTLVAYYSYPAFIGLLLNLIKPIKRKFYIRSSVGFGVRLDDLLSAHLPRGERNAANAYQLANKRYRLSLEDAQKCYQELRQSFKANGYDPKHPMYVMLNRKFGVKDQLLQGHHRIGICKELGINEVYISFWAAPANFRFLRHFILTKKS